MVREHTADVPGSDPSEGSPPGPACGRWAPPLPAHPFLSCFSSWRLPQGVPWGVSSPSGHLISISNGTRPLSRPLVVPPGTCSLKSWTSPSSTGSFDTRPSSPCHTSTGKGKRQPGAFTERPVRRGTAVSLRELGGGGLSPAGDAQRGSLAQTCRFTGLSLDPRTLHCPAPVSHTACSPS